jgi:hypothetical protein
VAIAVSDDQVRVVRVGRPRKAMMSLGAVLLRSASQCELCRRDEALPESRLCDTCTDAVIRLIAIEERTREEYLCQAVRAEPPGEDKVVARGFAPFWA